LKVLSEAALSDAPEESFSEEVLKKLCEGGDQLRMARTIFIAFGVAAIILSIVITLTVLFSIQSPPN
jgi:translation elongation factor EF-1beta